MAGLRNESGRLRRCVMGRSGNGTRRRLSDNRWRGNSAKAVLKDFEGAVSKWHPGWIQGPLLDI